MTLNTTISTFTSPLSPTVRQLAKRWSNQHRQPEKARQILHNTLAVAFVNFYCQCLGISTNLESSDSWNPIGQSLLDVADLTLTHLGKLECRAVLAGTDTVYIPPEVQADRIGYVAVEISENYREAKLLGFLRQVAHNYVSISQFEPLENFLDYLDILQIKQATTTSSLPESKTVVNLQKWLENMFEETWLPIANLLGTQTNTTGLSFRNNVAVGRAKQINLGIDLTGKLVVLVVTLSPENREDMNISVEAHPSKGNSYLPPNLQLVVLDADGSSVMEAQAKQENSNIQFKFSGESGERFSVKLVLGEISVIEDFVV